MEVKWKNIESKLLIFDSILGIMMNVKPVKGELI